MGLSSAGRWRGEPPPLRAAISISVRLLPGCLQAALGETLQAWVEPCLLWRRALCPLAVKAAPAAALPAGRQQGSGSQEAQGGLEHSLVPWPLTQGPPQAAHEQPLCPCHCL